MYETNFSTCTNRKISLQKLNEEALAHATMQYNVQLSSMRTENSMLTSSLEKERASKDKLETEVRTPAHKVCECYQPGGFFTSDMVYPIAPGFL